MLRDSAAVDNFPGPPHRWPTVPGMEIIEAILCEGCGYRMQWIYEHSPWGRARVVCCRRCDNPEDFAGLL